MVPKIIHYCWFGGNPLPDSVLRCIESWKKYCPDYEIKEWNEQNFDIHSFTYTEEAYSAKKWAFVSDIARLHALVSEGGIYLDTDMELLKPLDDLLMYEATAGFESIGIVGTAYLSCCQGHPLFYEFMKQYTGNHFYKDDGTYDLTTNVQRFTQFCLRQGITPSNYIQTIAGLTVFPADYFYPKDYRSGVLTLTENSYGIHHYDSSWFTEEEHCAFRLETKLERYIPLCLASRIAKFLSIIRHRGLRQAFCETVRWLEKKQNKKS